MTTVNTIAGEFTKARYDRLKKAYKWSVRNNYRTLTMPMFDTALTTEFAKYLLEFLDPHFKHIK